ncbi:putative Zn-dependent protease with MMP-like domain [Pseudarthrobacter siccitolerans]|uniref:Zn-dependent protease with MMP-like domain n=1 Tax=Pseudarthrobacter siccitolerans TaxID=861266 RepID=A0ABU0PQS7_9MICC|nr:metallopeptidase family protein [Pseudarthrobacter siccitolerans]MDQ0675591.1 putative Zn-dependent protease with MMP-like domain [Pseudarthrobacter siccitolerans]
MPASLPPGLPTIPEGPSEPLHATGPVHFAPSQAFRMSADEFETAVQDALDSIPEKLAQAMDNVAVFIDDDYAPRPGEDPDTVLLGLYEGVPLTERDSWWDAGSLPDRITIFREPILEICGSREDVIHEVAVTVVHEIAHHFGIDDERLHELGWD